MAYRVNMREVTYALSEALDYVGIDDVLHGKRVAYMAAETARHMGWSQQRVDDLIFLGMLHDCGVSETDVHRHLVTELDWVDSQDHCERGARLLETVDFYRAFAPVIAYHHTHWNALPVGLDPTVALHANLIYLVDRVDALRAQRLETGSDYADSIRETIEEYTGNMFAPELVEAFITLSKAESFWYSLEREPLDEYFLEWIGSSEATGFDFARLKELAMMFSAIVDAKSPFTSEHSIGVAALATHLGTGLGLERERLERIELAALLHDLGKLRVDDAILNKPGPLNAEERLVMNRHGFDSDIILRRIRGLNEIARIASLHHETLDGAGYPCHLSGEEIPMEARIVTVADIFQALVQDRPYRKGMSAEAACSIIGTMSDAGKLDSDVVALLINDNDVCLQRALTPYPERLAQSS